MKFLCIVLMVIFSGCKVTGTFSVQKDWFTEQNNCNYSYAGPDLKTQAMINFSN